MAEKLLYLSRADVESCGLGVEEIIEALERAFVIKGQGGVELPPKPGVHPRPDSFLHAMPAYVAGLESAGIKWVSAYPANPGRGLPYIAALVVLNDPETGLPIAVMDGAWMTAWRTAAVSAVTAKLLARSGAEVLAVCGGGVQGRTNLQALSLVLTSLKEVRIFETSPQALKSYLNEMVPLHPGLELKPVGSALEAVKGADVILTAGPMVKNPSPVIREDWLVPGCLGLPIDFDNYFTPAAFLACNRLFTDDLNQLRYYQSLGSFPGLPEEIIDLGDLAAGKVPGRRNDQERLIGCNLGIAMDDVVTGGLLLEKAKARGLGTWLDL